MYKSLISVACRFQKPSRARDLNVNALGNEGFEFEWTNQYFTVYLV